MNEQLNEDITTEVTLIELVEKAFVDELISPYKMCKIVNALLVTLEVVKVLPPQMFYNYSAKQFIKNNVDKKISREEAIRWSTKYLAKTLS